MQEYIYNVKTNPVAFFQAFESCHIDGGVVNKKIFITFLLNEAVSFFIAKPFYCSFCQSFYLLNELSSLRSQLVKWLISQVVQEPLQLDNSTI